MTVVPPIPGSTRIGGDFRLFTPHQVSVATFLGSPLAGSLLIAHNLRKTGQAGDARAIGLGLAATLAALGLAWVLPESFPAAVLPAAYTGATWALARSMFEEDIARHRELGGRIGGWPPTIGVGVASGVAVVVGFVALAMLYSPDPLAYGPSHVYWEQGADEAEARAVGDWMSSNGVFDEARELDVKVVEPGGALAAQFFIDPEGLDDAMFMARMTAIAVGLTHSLGRPVQVHLLDDGGTTLEVVHPR